MKKLKPKGKLAPAAAAQARPAAPAAGSPAGIPLFLRSKAEASLGRSLDAVRLHTDSTAGESARSLAARAYTTGRDIVFASGEYNPQTREGQRLLAHELAHVVQQSGGAPTPAVSRPADRFEQAADQAADNVMADSPAALAPATGAPVIQRQSEPHLKPPPMLARALGSGTIDGFVTNSAALDQAKKVQIGTLAASILSLREDYPGCSIDLTGHTDATGPEAFNDTLGQQRADAVREELVNNGVPPEIIGTSSAGSHQLKVKTDASEPRNRRVDIRFEPEARFHIVPELTLPTAPGVTPAPPPPKLFPPPLLPTNDDAQDLGKRLFAPIPPLPPQQKTPSKSLLDGIDKAMDSVLERLKIPSLVRPLLKSAAKAAATKAVTTPLDAAMDKSNLSANEKEAIRTAFKATIEIAWP